MASGSPTGSLLEDIMSEPVGQEIPEQPTNPLLDEILEFYDCAELIPYAQHIMWLTAVKEAIGIVPFNLDYFTIDCMVILQQEISKKSTAEAQQMAEKNKALESRGIH